MHYGERHETIYKYAAKILQVVHVPLTSFYSSVPQQRERPLTLILLFQLVLVDILIILYLFLIRRPG